jgi:SLA1 homology domain 1, SHD1
MYPHERSLVNSMTGRPFSLLGVNNDDKLTTVKTAIRENEINWRSWYDGSDGPICKKFEISSFPTIFLIDHAGVIRYKNVRNPELLDAAIEKLVREAEQAIAGGDVKPPEPEFRKYVDSTGKFKVDAKFVSFAGGMVELEKKAGGKISLALEKLSEDDRQYLELAGYLREGTIADTGGVEAAPVATVRVFTDITGEHKVTASFVRLDGANVKLRKEDGTEIVLSMDKLSESDQEWIRDHDDNPPN